eukprot:gene15807-33348_t
MNLLGRYRPMGNANIRACLGLGERKRSDQLATRHALQVVRLLRG